MKHKFHNPDGLVSKQVGRNWRLLLESEKGKPLPKDAELWCPNWSKWVKSPSARRLIKLPAYSYRTRQPLPRQKKRRGSRRAVTRWVNVFAGEDGLYIPKTYDTKTTAMLAAIHEGRRYLISTRVKITIPAELAKKGAA